MSTSSLLDCALLLQRQAGVVSRAQALAAGLTGGQVDRLVARRRWRPVHPRVYRDADHGFTDEARLRAAVLWAGAAAVPRGGAALWWHGLLPALPDTITLAVPGRCPNATGGVVVCTRTLPDRHLITVRGLSVPVGSLALLDASVEAGAGGAALLRALHGQVGLAELRSVADHALGRTSARRLLAEAQGAHAAGRPT